MDSNTLAIIIAVFAMLIVGVWAAYGEPYEDSIRFEVPDDSQFMQKQCQFKSIGEHLRYSCDWTFNFEKAKQWIEQQEETFQEEMEELLESEKTPDSTPEEPEKTPTEKLIEKLETEQELGETSTADDELLRLLKSLNECYRGLGNSDPIQTDGSWIIPDDDPRTLYKAYSYRSNDQLGKLVMAFEECKGQRTLESDKVTGPQYGNIANATINDIQTYHGNNTIAQSKEPTIYPDSENTPYLLQANQERAHLQICLSDYYPEGFKRQMGCTIQYDSKQYNATRHELTDIQKEAHKRAGAVCEMNMPVSYKMDMGCQIVTQPNNHTKNNVSPIDNPAFEEWWYYQLDPINNDDRQLEKARQKALAKYFSERAQ